MTRSHWTALRKYVRQRRVFWWAKDAENRDTGKSSVEALRALCELAALSTELTRIRKRQQTRRTDAS